MDQNFILTYSVKAQTERDSDIQKATKVRDSIAGLDYWEKLVEVETTFSGNADITGITDSDKKNSATKQVEKQFLPILEKHNANSYSVKMHCAIMTEKLATPFEFIIKN